MVCVSKIQGHSPCRNRIISRDFAAYSAGSEIARPVHAALCDHTNSLKGIACGWPHYFYKGERHVDSQKIETSRYYDGINFARLITDKQAGWFSFGYNDDVVPPTTAYETYNIVTGPKELSPYQQTWHFWYQEQWD